MNMPLPSLRVPMLTKNETRPAFTESMTAKSIADIRDRLPPLPRAQKFPDAA